MYNSLDAGALSVEVWLDLGPNVRIQVGRPKETVYGCVVDPDPVGSGFVPYLVEPNEKINYTILFSRSKSFKKIRFSTGAKLWVGCGSGTDLQRCRSIQNWFIC